MARYGQSTTVMKRNERRDMQELINLILSSPVNPGPVERITGQKALQVYSKANTDVKTRILIQFAVDAMHGDKKAAEFLFKYGGLEPREEQMAEIAAPVIINDIPMPPAEEMKVIDTTARSLKEDEDGEEKPAPKRRSLPPKEARKDER